jgi:cytochrome P450
VTERNPQWNAGGSGLDLADPHLYRGDRYFELWRQARRTHPVAWCEGDGGGFWSVTSHEHGSQVLRRQHGYTSVHGMRLGADPAGVQAASGRMLVVSDGDDHRALRAAHMTWFGGTAVAALGADLEPMVYELVREVVERGTVFDAVTEIAQKVPMWVLFQMMGIPQEDRVELTRLTATAFDDADQSPAGAAARRSAHTAVFAYFAELTEQRRAHPGQDIVTSLTQASTHGRPLTDEEVILNCDGLLNGGLETTPHAISGAIIAFAEHPAAWQRLRSEPSLMDRAVEEVLRWTSPPTHAMRTATADTVLGTARIRQGDQVVVWIPSCNRDEKVFADPDPDTFAIDRAVNPHLCFSAGPHYCAGARLARIELRCVLAAMARLVDAIEPAGQILRQPSNFLHGLSRLEVRMTPGPPR